MKEVLVFVAPTWSPQLEELIQVTKESFSIKVITEKTALSTSDPFIEILQCLETYSPLELGKLLPWLIQLKPKHFHFILPSEANPRQLAGVGAIASLASAIPNARLTHSEWPNKTWAMTLWIKAFGGLFKNGLSIPGKRALGSTHQRTNPEPPSSERGLELYRQLWIFPSLKGVEQDWQKLIACLLMNRENLLEFWNWEQLPIRHQNKIRDQFAMVWSQFRTHSPRLKLGDWRNVQFLVLIGQQASPFSETDLLDLALELEIAIVMDTHNRRQLRGPWKDGDSFWLWNQSQEENDNRPWNAPYTKLPFASKTDLKNYRDQISNQVLRSFIRLDFQD